MLTDKTLGKNRRFRLVFLWLSLALLFFSMGCGQPRGELFPELDHPLQWPAPPEMPRIKYLGELSTEDDLRREVSSAEGLRRIFFGPEQIGVMVCPYAVALDKDQRLYISDTAGAVIHMMDLSTRKYLQFSDLNDGAKIQTPVGLALGEGILYVADSDRAEICVFNPEGNYLYSFGSGRFVRPSGVAFCSAYKKLYVTDAAQHVIFVFDPQGDYLDKIGARGVKAGEFNFPTHLWVDKTGRLYVSDTLNYRIQVFSPTGECLFTIGQQGDRPGYFAHPCGVATDSFGNIYVTDKQFENVQIFNQEGQILMAFGGEGSNPGQFWLPAGIFIDESNRIFTTDSFNKRVQVFKLLEERRP